MKLLIASDIHGSAYYAQSLINLYKKLGATKLLLLGDILYHGPRNPLPRDYSPQRVAEILGAYANDIICVRGNCDAEVDQMVLPFNIMNETAVFCADEKTQIYLTHGHKFNPENPLPMPVGSIMLFGHIHVPVDKTINGIRFLNPGSTSLPKDGSNNSCLFYNGENFEFKTLE